MRNEHKRIGVNLYLNSGPDLGGAFKFRMSYSSEFRYKMIISTVTTVVSTFPHVIGWVVLTVPITNLAWIINIALRV